MNLAFTMPMFGFSCLAFLLMCTVLAVALWIAIKSGEKGTTKLNGLAGCAIAFGLVAVAGMMAMGTLTVMWIQAQNEFVRRGPVKSFEFELGPAAPEPGSAEAGDDVPAADELLAETGDVELVVRFLLRDPGGIAEVVDYMSKHVSGDLRSSSSEIETPEGSFTQVEIRARIDRAEFEPFKEGLNEAFPGMRLPSGGRIELRDPGE